MGGRKSRPLKIKPKDRALLEEIARSHRRPGFEVERARIVLGIAAGRPVDELASYMYYDRSTIWRICRRYEAGGLEPLFIDEPRLGHPPAISPSAAS